MFFMTFLICGVCVKDGGYIHLDHRAQVGEFIASEAAQKGKTRSPEDLVGYA